MKQFTLILDADDTLWDNNVFYERTIDQFTDRLARAGFDQEQARQTFTQVERERVPQVGYAPQEFINSMVIAYHHLCRQNGHEIYPEIEADVKAIGQQVIQYPLILLDNVDDTLAQLASYCRLFLLTKGNHETQMSKIERSGLARYFETIHIVSEKTAGVLLELIEQYNLNRHQTWMVGNSPRSDINPALEAGIGAVYIPYAMTWAFEKTPITDSDRVVTLETFSDLLDRFPKPEDM